VTERQSLPQNRQEGLMVETVETEVLVYDVERAQANCLNQTAALVWQNADGKTSVPQLAQKLSQELSAPVDEGVVWYALDQLNKKHLLQGEFHVPAQMGNSRREFLKRAALVGAVVAVPAVVAMVAPTAAQAATCVASGQACTSGPNCCSTVCIVGFCA
jgi:hypothetical protein